MVHLFTLRKAAVARHWSRGRWAMSTKTEDQVWFVTGASRGLGREITDYALRNGHNVVAAARDTSLLIPLLDKYPRHLLPVTLDVTRSIDIHTAVATALNRFGRIDVLVNNAGFDVVGLVEETTPEQERSLFDTHFFGPLEIIKQVLPHMRQRKSGTIVNISSVLTSDPSPGFGIYSATKAALEAMSESMQAEVEPYDIRVVVVKPGSFRTEILDPRHTLQMTPETTKGAYDHKQTKDSHTAICGLQRGDPRRAAEAVGVVLQEHRPPLRVLLGSDSYERVTKALQAELRDYEAWRELSLSTDFPEGGK